MGWFFGDSEGESKSMMETMFPSWGNGAEKEPVAESTQTAAPEEKECRSCWFFGL